MHTSEPPLISMFDPLFCWLTKVFVALLDFLRAVQRYIVKDMVHRVHMKMSLVSNVALQIKRNRALPIEFSLTKWNLLIYSKTSVKLKLCVLFERLLVQLLQLL